MTGTACKPCTDARNRAYYERDREARKQYSRDYYANNKDKCLAWAHEYYTLNADERRAYRREYRKKNVIEINAGLVKYYWENREKYLENNKKRYLENRESHIALASKWAKENKDKKRVYHERRRAAKMSSRGILSADIVGKLMKAQEGLCLGCGKPLLDKIHLDHFTPLSKGGDNSDENVQLLHARCNIRKTDLMPLEWFKRFDIKPYLPPFAKISEIENIPKTGTIIPDSETPDAENA